jgi:uncharacterized Zn-binding protein involved in type VI secretion
MKTQGMKAQGMVAAKQGDKVVAVDTHIIMVPSPGGPVPTPMPMPFNGTLSGALSGNVLIENRAAATKTSTATNAPAHVPAGGPFQRPPSNKATIQTGSSNVLINNKQAARTGDPALTCNDPADAPNGSVIGSGTVLVGG